LEQISRRETLKVVRKPSRWADGICAPRGHQKLRDTGGTLNRTGFIPRGMARRACGLGS